jgi:hypothetical protein
MRKQTLELKFPATDDITIVIKAVRRVEAPDPLPDA